MSGLPEYFPDDNESDAGHMQVSQRTSPDASPDSIHASGEPLIAASDLPISTDPPVILSPSNDCGEIMSPSPIDLPASAEPLFARFEYPPPLPPSRKPNFGDSLLFALLGFGGSLCAGLVVLCALHYHLLGISTFKQANEEIHYRIGSQAVWYLSTVLFCVLVFPLVWRKSFFEGIEWRASAAARQIWRLLGAAAACFLAAIADEILMPGPDNAPIDETFRMPGAVWVLFAFGVTLAPLIEEITFRGFLLPSLCTAYDWMVEQLTASKPRFPDENGFPQWSMPAMVVASILTSIPFALMHGQQTAYSIGPFLLLVCISLVLCWVRLVVRSLAASVVVHSSYNLLLFTLMFFGTGGFRHLDKM
jgi:hypothetical protein